MQITKLQGDSSRRSIFRVYGSDGLPFEDINCFLRYQEKRDYSPNTVKAAAHDLVRYFVYLNSIGKAWHAVSHETLVDYIHFLRFDTGHKSLSALPASGLTRSESTISRMLSSVSSFYKYQYHSTGLDIGFNKIKDDHSDFKSFLSFASRSSSLSSKRTSIQLLKRTKRIRRPKIVSDSDQLSLLKKCTNRRDRLLILLLQETGMRIGQALQLKHEDIESWNSQLKVVYRLNNPNEVYAKSRTEYYIDLSADWIRLYTDYIVEDCEGIDSEFVFIGLYSNNPEHIGRPLTYSTVKDLFKRLSKAIGVEVTPHMLRHSHATALLRSGVPIELVSKRLGHHSVDTTKSIYEHLTAADIRHAINQAKGKGQQCER